MTVKHLRLPDTNYDIEMFSGAPWKDQALCIILTFLLGQHHWENHWRSGMHCLITTQKKHTVKLHLYVSTHVFAIFVFVNLRHHSTATHATVSNQYCISYPDVLSFSQTSENQICSIKSEQWPTTTTCHLSISGASLKTFLSSLGFSRF